MGILLLFFASALQAQIVPEPSLMQRIYSDAAPKSSATVQIIAAMVEFQPDDNRFTSGNGTFHLDYLDRDDITIGPLPHDQGYFEAHLEFARNYFAQASNGMLDIEYLVLPEVYRLPNEMKEYSPTGPDDSENFRLGNLAADAWQLIAQSDLPDLSGFDPDNTLFIIFHAGAGRDIELTGTTLNNTPQDIPSVYLSKAAIGRLINNPDFNGFPLGDLNVTNTAILPQTQSRAGEDVTGAEFVLELSINGILVANIGSFLGLPDLFNTETGSSGIGRFGLMDGAGIFSYYGMFPPLPSAWERIFLGWDEAFDIDLDESQTIDLPAISTTNAPSVARHRISADEYFLVENRHRDPDDTGVTLTFRLPDGSIETRTITNDEERFNPFDQRRYDEILPAGVLINVSNFDWSLPGGLDAGEDQITGTDDDRLLNGGILIWHIDEAVIRAKFDDNSINANPDRPGVALQEADGVQDIGRPGTTFANFANGGPFDFWWSGNDFTVITATGQRIVLYENRFGDDTFPNNRSNTGSISYFEFFDFSDNLSVASFRARPANPGMAELVFEHRFDGMFEFERNQFLNYPVGLQWYESDNRSFILIPGRDQLYAIETDENGIPKKDNIFEFPQTSDVQIYSGDVFVKAWQENNEIVVQAWEWNEGIGNFQLAWENEVDGTLSGILSSSDGATLDVDGTPFRFNLNDGSVSEISGGFQQSGTLDGVSVSITGDILTFSSGREIMLGSLADSERQYAGMARIESNNPSAAFLIRDDSFSLLSQTSADEDRLIMESGAFSWPAMADFNGDGLLDFLFINVKENSLDARNINSARLWNFPKDAPEGLTYTGVPLLSDITGNGEQEIILTAKDSLSITIRAYNKNLQLLDGFPLYVGSLGQSGAESSPPYMFFNGNNLYTIANTGDMKVWRFDDMLETSWPTAYGSAEGNKVTGIVGDAATPQPGITLLNREETYNWPNPARDHTYLRFETNGEAEIEITVITMNGNRLFEAREHSRGGVPQEVFINTSSWSSGVYYARVKATQNNRSETRLIKIAVMQ